MKLWNLAVDNRVAVYILVMIIVLFGLDSYLGLPREAAPDITIPFVIVSVPYPGVSPGDMEGLVTMQLEQEFKTLKDVKQVTSSSKEGLATVFIEFETGVDVDEALRRVRDKTNTARSSLPTDILEPIISEINFSEFPILYVNIGGEVGLPRLKTIAKDLQDRIEGIPGVLSADITGDLEPEVQINCDVDRLKGYDISFSDVVSAIQAEHITIPGGSIDNGTTDYTVRVPGEYKNPAPIEDIIVKMRNGQPIYVRDVAQVTFAFEDRKTYARLNDEQVVTLPVKKRAGENLVRIAEDVRTTIAAFLPTLPKGVTVEVTNDQSIMIEERVYELENSIMTGMFLVILVLFMFFGVKNAILISTAIPLSMFMGFIVLSIMGVTLNFVVLFALVLVLGIVVDDAIVVIENIYRHQQEYGENLITAAKKATSEVAVPVTTATLTTIAAFLPLLFWPGVVGDFMSFLPITLIATMLSSLVVAFVISPVQGSVFINYRKEIAKARHNLEHPSRWRKYNPFTIAYHWVDEKFFPAAQKQYVGALGWTLNHKKKTIFGSFALLIVVIVVFGMFNSGVEFFPNTQPAQLTVMITTPPGTPLEVTNDITLLVERKLKEIDGYGDIEFRVTSVGASNNPFDFGGSSISNKSNYALSMYAKKERRQSSFETLDEIRDATKNIPGADVKVEVQQMGPPVGEAVNIEIAGEDFAQLRALSAAVQEQIRDIPGLVDLDDDYDSGKPEVQVIVDREKAALLEMSTAQIGSTVRTAVNGTEAAKFRVGEDEYKITVRLRADQRQTPEDIQNLNITFMNRRGQLLSVPLTSVAQVVRTTGLTDIRRKDYKRVVTITADAQGRLANDVLADVKSRLASFAMPAGYSISFAGEQKEQEEAASFLFRALLVTVFLIFLLMVSEFNSIKVPFVIMVSVLLAQIGVLIGLLVTRQPFGIIMTGVGIIALAGIVVKNAIVLLDFAKQKVAEGMPLEDALLEAGRTRLRPVVLTAVSTILGVIPLATGIDIDWRKFTLVVGAESSDFWRGLGIAIISGLSVSTFLTLVVIPTMYAYLEESHQSLATWLRKLFRREKPKPEALPER
ncbi:MAG: efflux RND transporter permease subunit [Bacteroidota bacterium]|jgi:CzcA family heavy metal efflux pump|nr:efflux RND transporter permease subunit [Bacteroidota bacterium]